MMNSRSTPPISNVSSWDWSCDEEGGEAASGGSRKHLPHTHRLILEFKQFKAAQLIQRYVRGWLVRSHMRKLLLAAVVIQKWWRRYMAQRILFVLAQSKLQLAVVSHFNSCATLIQKTFRGWWTRRHFNDLTKLKSMQESLAGSILHILALHLHGLKRKAQLPGVHGEHLPQECLGVIEQLKSSVDYRIYNSFSCYRMQRALTLINDLRAVFKKSTYYTEGPISGFDCGEIGDRRLSCLTMDGDANEKAHSIRSFGCRKHDADLKTKFARKVPDEEASMKLTLDDTILAFLKRIFLDMKKWQDPKGNEMLPKTTSRKTNIKAILEEVKANLAESCYCGDQYADM